jgi:hypothetical protein
MRRCLGSLLIPGHPGRRSNPGMSQERDSWQRLRPDTTSIHIEGLFEDNRRPFQSSRRPFRGQLLCLCLPRHHCACLGRYNTSHLSTCAISEPIGLGQKTFNYLRPCVHPITTATEDLSRVIEVLVSPRVLCCSPTPYSIAKRTRCRCQESRS